MLSQISKSNSQESYTTFLAILLFVGDHLVTQGATAWLKVAACFAHTKSTVVHASNLAVDRHWLTATDHTLSFSSGFGR